MSLLPFSSGAFFGTDDAPPPTDLNPFLLFSFLPVAVQWRGGPRDPWRAHLVSREQNQLRERCVFMCKAQKRTAQFPVVGGQLYRAFCPAPPQNCAVQFLVVGVDRTVRFALHYRKIVPYNFGW